MTDLSNVSSRLLEPTKASNFSRHHVVIREEEEKRQQEQALLEAAETSSTTPTKPNRNRRHRPSFRGLSIIDESKGSNARQGGCMKPAQIGAIKVRSNRANRRRKTMDVLWTAASAAVRRSGSALPPCTAAHAPRVLAPRRGLARARLRTPAPLSLCAQR